MNNKKLSNMKAVVSITEIARILNLSRSRFYQLLQSGFFPKPKYDDRSNRPYYNLELQQKCLECRQSGIGIDGSFMLFYSPRKSATVSDMRRKKIDPVVKEFAEILESMGLETAFNEVQKALSVLYPDGTKGIEQGVIIRELFRYFKESV